jgi:hypothetical protein
LRPTVTEPTANGRAGIGALPHGFFLRGTEGRQNLK